MKPDPVLLTPGPLTTARATREAMLKDWGSWDSAFHEITRELRLSLVAIVHGESTHTCVPLQGSGTFSVEAAIGTVVPKNGKILVPVNGAYCKRMARICEVIGRKLATFEVAEDQQITAAAIEAALQKDPAITHVGLVHCETGTGILNPLREIAGVCAKHGKGLIIDAMSTFGALEIDSRSVPFDACVAASGKCLEGVPGMGFVLVKKTTLEKCAGNAHSLAMDLFDQWQYLEKTAQWRYTPPTHVAAALLVAVKQFEAEGGQPARGARYRRNYETLVSGMKALGFLPFLNPEWQAPIIVTFFAPADSRYEFKRFYACVRDNGFILYPGKLTEVETFRVGCIGAIGPDTMQRAVDAVAASLTEMGIPDGTPAHVAARKVAGGN